MGAKQRPNPARSSCDDVFELGGALADVRACLNADSTGTYHFPGFGGEVSQFLVEERDIIGVGVDSHSIDVGPSTTFPAHITILGAGKIGVEVLAGLDEVLRQTDAADGLPFVFIGGLKTLHGSGSPVRDLALV